METLVHRLLPRSVRSLQMLVLLVALGPVLLVQAGIYSAWMDLRRQAELQANLVVARAVAAAFDAYVRAVDRQNLAIGLALTSAPMSPEQAGRFLRANAEELPSLRGFTWVDPAGRVVASSRPDGLSQQIGDRPYFRQILEGRQSVVSDLLAGQPAGEPAFAIARGLRDESGSLLGVAVASVDPRRLDGVLAVERQGSGLISIIDGSGRALYRYPDGDLTSEQRDWRVTDPAIATTLAGEETSEVLAAKEDGPEQFVARAPIQSLGWAAVASRPVAEVMGPVTEGLVRDAALLGLVSLAALLAALRASRWLIGPLARLREQAVALGSGDLDRRVEVGSPAEVAEVAGAINRMTKEIQIREGQRTRLVSQLTTANEQLLLAGLRAQDLANEARSAVEEVRARALQQGAVADLGQRALAGDDLSALLDRAVGLVADTLGVEYVGVLELLPGEQGLLLRAGRGWRAGVVGSAIVDVGAGSQCGYTLLSGEPVIVEDLPTETRFSLPPLLRDHSVVSGVSIIIPGREDPFGVLGAHTVRRRTFSRDDVHFLQVIANVLAAAIERKAMDAELQASRNQLRVVLEGIADGVTAQDPEGRVVYANDAAARVVGYPSAEAFLKAPLSEVRSRFQIMDESGSPFPHDQLPGRRALRGQPSPEATIRFLDLATGEERWSIVKAQAVFDQQEKIVLAINIFREVTERRREEESERFLAEATAVLASSLDCETTLARVAELAVSHIADWCTVYLVAEDGSARRLVTARADPAGTEPAWETLPCRSPSTVAPMGLGRLLHSGRPALYPEVTDAALVAVADDEEHLRSLRELGVGSIMVAPMVIRGRTLGAISLMAAESNRRYGSRGLALAEHLGRRAALAVDNARLYREAQEAMRVRNELFSSISHDLKNPLTGIKGMAQLLNRQLTRDDAPGIERVAEGLARIDAIATRMTAQINELLDLAHLQMGQPLAMDRHPTDLVSLAREMAEVHQQATDRHRIRVEASVPELIGPWDRARLERVLANLLSNAVKYSPEGGEILVAVAREEGEEGSPVAILSVQDRGLGIPTADLPQIFHAFHRGANVAGRIGGTGIGLAGARRIVELHGGTIAVASEEGRGSTFVVRLPLNREATGGQDVGLARAA